MAIRVDKAVGRDKSGRIQYEKASQRPVYKPRSGGGYEVAFQDNDKPIQQGSYSADRSLAQAQIDAAARQALEEQKAAEQNTRDLKAAQTVTRQLNESAERTGSATRFKLTGDEQGNIYINKTTTEQNAQPRRTRETDVRNRGSLPTREIPQAEATRTSKQGKTAEVSVLGTNSDLPRSDAGSNSLSGYERRILALEERERRAAERLEKQDNFLRRVPLLKGDNFAQRTGRTILGAPFNAVQGVPIITGRALALGEGLFRPETRQQSKELALQAFKETPAEAARQNDPRTPEGLVNLGLSVLGVRGVRGAKAKVQVTKSRTQTVEAELPGRRTVDVTEGQFKVTSGKRVFEAETRTGGTTRPDAQGTLLRTEKTQIVLREVKGKRTGREFTGAARADLQIKPTGRGSRAKGTQTQVTNINNRRAIQESGRTVSKTLDLPNDVSVTRSFTETSKPQKVKPVKDPELVTYPKELGKPTSAQVAQAKSRKLVELEAPLYPKIAEAAGIEVRAATQPVRQTLSESRGVALSGQRVLKVAKDPVRTQRGVSVRKTESGRTLVNVDSTVKVAPPTRTRAVLPSPSSPAALTKTTFRTPTVNPTPRVQAQVKAAAASIVNSQRKAIPVVVPTNRATRAQTRLEARTETRQEPKQEPPISLPRQQQRSETAQLPAQKPRTEALSDLAQALKPARRTRDSQRQTPEIIQLPAQRQQQREEIIQLPVVEPAQRQRGRTTQQTRALIPELPRTRIAGIAPPSFKRSNVTEDGFAVFVRRGGKFSRINAAPLAKGAALKLGADTARNTAARSFRIEKTTGRATKKRGSTSLDDFYQSRKERGVFVQKAKTSLSSAGEFREITAKGIRASRGRL